MYGTVFIDNGLCAAIILLEEYPICVRGALLLLVYVFSVLSREALVSWHEIDFSLSVPRVELLVVPLVVHLIELRNKLARVCNVVDVLRISRLEPSVQVSQYVVEVTRGVRLDPILYF